MDPHPAEVVTPEAMAEIRRRAQERIDDERRPCIDVDKVLDRASELLRARGYRGDLANREELIAVLTALAEQLMCAQGRT